jgi:hypothetical protein
MKKNVFTLLLFILIAGAATAQTEQGNWLVGGNLNLNTASNNTQFDVTPMAGYFFANNLAAGLNLNVDLTKFGTAKTTAWGLGPFVRYYFGTANVRPLLDGSFDYTSRKTKVTSVDASSTSNAMDYFLGGGVAAFINRNVAIEGLAGYSHTKIRHSGEDAGSGGFNLRIGFQVYLSSGQMSSVTK